MKKEQSEFIIETLGTAIEWAEYATPYFQEKHNLARDKEDVQKAIELLRESDSRSCESCSLNEYRLFIEDRDKGVFLMTREDINYKLAEMARECYSTYQMEAYCLSLIEDIFADLRLELEAEYQRGQEDVLSRTCEGCKYWCKEKGCDLTYWQDYSHGYGFESEADDYCSRWEQK